MRGQGCVVNKDVIPSPPVAALWKLKATNYAISSGLSRVYFRAITPIKWTPGHCTEVFRVGVKDVLAYNIHGRDSP